jgi:hypothetical protein
VQREGYDLKTAQERRGTMMKQGCAALGIFALLILGIAFALVISGMLGLLPLPQMGGPEATATSSATPTLEATPIGVNDVPTPLSTALPPLSDTPVATSVETPPSPSATPVQASTLPSPGTSFDYGIQVHLFHLDAGYVCGLVNNIHFRWIKHQVEWKEYEPTKGQYQWQAIDGIVDVAHAARLNILLSVVKAPAWARGGRVEEDGPPSNYNDYGDFVGAMAQRYCGKVQAYEIWNEQNLRREWNTGRALSAREYVELLHVAYDRIKAVCPSAIVVSGGPTPVGYTSDTAIDDFQYLREMYQAGLPNYCDAVGIHPSGFNNPPDWHYPPAYSEPGDSTSFRGNRQFYFLNTIEGYYNIMAEFGDGDRKLWATEFGWASIENLTDRPNEGYEYATDNTELEQAGYLVDALRIARNKGYMGVMFIWNLNFAAARGNHDERAAFSIVKEDWSERPAYQTLIVARETGELP